MPLLEKLFNGISVQRKFTRCMTFIHVCFFGTVSVIKIFKMVILFFLWILGLTSNFNLTFYYNRIEVYILLRFTPDDFIVILCKWCHSFVFDLLLIVNFFLLRATFKKNILSIDIWLVVHGIHFLYIIFSFKVFPFTDITYTLICASIYCIYILLVISFRMEECNNSIFHKIMNYFRRGS